MPLFARLLFFSLAMVFPVVGQQALQSELKVVLPSGSAALLKIHRIGAHSYVSLQECSAKLFSSAVFSASESSISFSDEKVLFSPSSFFLLRRSRIIPEKIAQLPIPIVRTGDLILAPAPAIFAALGHLGLYKADTFGFAANRKIHLREPNKTTTKERSEALSNRAAAVGWKKAAPSGKKKPGAYYLPADLSVPSNEDLLAERSTDKPTSPEHKAALISATAKKYPDSINIVFTANDVVHAFQRPEIQENTVVFRVPNVLFSAKPDLSLVQKDIQFSGSETIRDIVVLRFQCTKKPISATARRDPADKQKTIILSIQFSETTTDGGSKKKNG